MTFTRERRGCMWVSIPFMLKVRVLDGVYTVSVSAQFIFLSSSRKKKKKVSVHTICKKLTPVWTGHGPDKTRLHIAQHDIAQHTVCGFKEGREDHRRECIQYNFLSYFAVEVGECWSERLVEWRKRKCTFLLGSNDCCFSAERCVDAEWWDHNMIQWNRFFQNFRMTRDPFYLRTIITVVNKECCKTLRVTCLFGQRLPFKRNRICIFSRATYKKGPCDLFTLPINNAILVTWGRKLYLSHLSLLCEHSYRFYRKLLM